MKVEKLSALVGLLIMGLALIFIPIKEVLFQRIFGVGVGLSLTYVVVEIINGIIYLVKNFK